MRVRRFIFTVSLLGLMTLRGFAALEPKILYEEDSTLLTSTIEVVVLSGMLDDPTEKIGRANLLGEILLRGTKKRSRSLFQSEVERLGGTISVSVSHDKMVFVGAVIKENTVPLLKLMDDFLLRPAFSEKEFTALKKEILAEISHQKNNNFRLAGLALRKELFKGTRLERPILGTLSTVGGLNLVDVQKAYNDHFHRANFIFAIASPIKEAELKKTLQETWLSFPDGVRHSSQSIPLNVPPVPTLFVIHKDKTSTGSLLMGQAGIVAQDSKRYALALGNYSFGAEPLVSRLFRTVRSELGWTYFINASYSSLGGLSHQQGAFTLAGTPSVEFTSKVILKLHSMWEEYLKSGLNEDEIRLGQNSLINSYPFDFESADKRLGQKLHSHLYGTPILSPKEYEKTLRALNNGSVKEALKEKHQSKGWVMTLVADSKVIEDQLRDEQQAIPESQRIKIAKILSPEDVIR